MNPAKHCFVALDNLSQEQILELLPKLKDRVGGIKIGLEAYLAFGPGFVTKAKSSFGGMIFLDLKLHDIPNTVAKAIHSLKGLPIDFLTVHASGGRAMLNAAVGAAKEVLPKTTILAVTVLTSLDDEDGQQIFSLNREQAFKKLYQVIQSAPGLGLVCSGAELELIADSNIISMVPGIRFEHEISNNQIQDQKSVFTPRQALERGATFLVIGRSLTQAQNLDQALKLLEQ